MFHLTSLPIQVLLEIFLNFNQHQVLAIAPQHSKLYFAARDKLYQNIYIYEEHQQHGADRNDFGFKFHKDINNIQTNKFTIISKRVFGKCLSQMRLDMNIQHLVFYEYSANLARRALRHFKSIRTFEAILSFGYRYRLFTFEEYMARFMLDDLKAYSSCEYTEFIPSPFVVSYVDTPLGIKTSLNVLVDDKILTWDFLKTTPFITNLTIIIACEKMLPKLVNFRLRKLHIHHTKIKVIDYTMSDIFDTSVLSELTIAGFVNFEKVFSEHELEKEYPCLTQLCLRHDGTELEENTIPDLLNFTHNGLSMLIIATKINNQETAKIISSLSSNFPLASINWWHEPRRFLRTLMEDIERVDSAFTHDIIMLSPQLPFGTIGYHFPKIQDTRSSRHRVHSYWCRLKDCPRQSDPFLKECYSDLELEVLYQYFVVQIDDTPLYGIVE